MEYLYYSEWRLTQRHEVIRTLKQKQQCQPEQVSNGSIKSIEDPTMATNIPGVKESLREMLKNCEVSTCSSSKESRPSLCNIKVDDISFDVYDMSALNKICETFENIAKIATTSAVHETESEAQKIDGVDKKTVLYTKEIDASGGVTEVFNERPLEILDYREATIINFLSGAGSHSQNCQKRALYLLNRSRVDIEHLSRAAEKITGNVFVPTWCDNLCTRLNDPHFNPRFNPLLCIR